MYKKMFKLYLSKIKGTVYYRGGVAAIDQGMISAINLGVQILLIKTVIKNDYGYYSVALAVIMYLISFQNAVVNTPITVSIAGKSPEVKNKYISSIFSGQLLALSIVSIVGLIAVFTLYSFGWDIGETLVAGALSIASFGRLNREFLRSYFFAEEKPEKVLKLDFYYGLFYAVLISISYIIFKINVPLIILFMGVASGFDSLILNKSINFSFNLKNIKSAYSENWLISKWSLLRVILIYMLSEHSSVAMR